MTGQFWLRTSHYPPQTTGSLIFYLLVATKNATGPATPFIRSFSVQRSHESRQK